MTTIVGDRWPTVRPGGLNRYVADLHAALRAHGHEVQALVVGPTGPLPAGVVSAGDVSTSLATRWRALRAAARRGPVPDVVDVHFAAYGWPLMRARGPWRTAPTVVHFHGPWADESSGRFFPILKRAVERGVYRRARTIVAISHAFADVVIDRYGVEPNRVRVIPPGVDLARFTPGPPAPSRAALGVATDAYVVLSVRRLEHRMGLDTLLDAWDDVAAAVPNAVLLIAGDGSLRAELDARRSRLQNPHSVRLLGRIDEADLAGVYRAADCTVVPSRELEGFGLVVLESLACGVPAVVTEVGGLPEAVADVDPTLVVPPDDAPALARRLVEAAGGRVPTAAACRAHAERFDWPTVAGRHVEIYRSAGNRPRVVFVDHTATPSGGELALARLLRVLDVDAHVVLGEDGPLVDRLDGCAVEIVEVAPATRRLRRDQVRWRRVGPRATVGALRSVWALARRLRRLRPDLVHTNSLKAHLYGGLAGRLAGVPVVWHLRDRLADDYLPRPAVRLARAAARLLPTHVIANSHATLATLPSRVARRATVVHGGVDLDEIGPPASRVDEGPLRIGIVGRLAPWKGHDVFLRAVAATHRDVVAVVVGSALFGEDDYAAELRHLADGLGLTVEWRGQVDDVGAEYRRLDVLVHASVVPEPFGQVVLEGMAAGLPVVATDRGGPAELVTHGHDGVLVPAGDVDAMARVLVDLIDHPDRRRSLASAARATAERRTVAHSAAEVLDVYRTILSAGPTR